MNPNTFFICRFDDAPEEYQKLSPHGGDEEFVMFVPTEHGHRYWVSLIINSVWFGCGGWKHVDVEGGTVYIGAH